MAEKIADVGSRGWSAGGMIIGGFTWSGAGRLAGRGAARAEGLGEPAGIAGEIDDERETVWNHLD